MEIGGFNELCEGIEAVFDQKRKHGIFFLLPQRTQIV